MSELILSTEVEQYSQELFTLGIEHEIVEHPALMEIPELVEYLGITLADTIPTMIMKAGDSFVAIIRRGDCRLDFKKVKKSINRRIRMATPQEFTDYTGLPLGAARVYIPDLPTYIDEKVFEQAYLLGGSGNFTSSIRYKTGDLKKLSIVEIVDVSQ